MARPVGVVLFWLAMALVAPVGVAQAAEAPFCAPGQEAQFVFGFAALKQRVGDRMGDPLECEHAGENGDALQQTTTGLVFYRPDTNTATFTDGWVHWALVPSGLISWIGSDIVPPAERGNAPDGPGLTCIAVGTRLCLSADMDAFETVNAINSTATGAPLLRTAASTGVRVRYGQTVPRTWAEFRSSGRQVILNRRIQTFGATDQAPVLAHELQHAADLALIGRAIFSAHGCFETEARAFETQVAVYRELHPNGLTRPTNALQQELEAVSRALNADRERFLERLLLLYEDECGD